MNDYRVGSCRPATIVSLAVATTMAIILAGCASSTERRSRASEATTAKVASRDAQLPRFRIRDWSAPNDHTVIVVADDGTRYRAETLGPCIGLDFAQSLAFLNRGGSSQVDRFSSVVLPDGTRCTFQSFDKLVPPETEALDRYEKSQEATGEEAKSEEGASPK